MCQYSLEGYPSRQAVDQEQLVLRRLDHVHGFISPQSRTKTLVCMQIGREMVIDEVRLRSELRGLPEAWRWHGHKNVPVKMASYMGSHHYNDALEMPDGTRLPLYWFEQGMTAAVGAKARDLDKALGLDQLRAEVPVAKEQDNVRSGGFHPAALARLFRL